MASVFKYPELAVIEVPVFHRAFSPVGMKMTGFPEGSD